MEIFGYILAALIVAGVAVWLYLRSTKAKGEAGMYSALDHLGIPRHKALFKHAYTTPGGCPVRSTVPVPAEALELIDRGLQRQIERWDAAHPEYAKGKNISEYSVLFIDPMAWNEFTPPGSPAILVQGQQSAGTCIGEVRSGWPLKHIVAPHQQDSNWSFKDYLVATIHHESEHIRPSINGDMETFNKYLGGGDVHPHIP